MKYGLAGLALVALTPHALAALPGDVAAGKRLHDANCLQCHDSSVYVKQTRSVQSLDALREQLGGCSHMAGKSFSIVENQDLLKYLNDEFYHFK